FAPFNHALTPPSKTSGRTLAQLFGRHGTRCGAHRDKTCFRKPVDVLFTADREKFGGKMRHHRKQFLRLGEAVLFTFLLAGSQAVNSQSALPKPDQDTVLKASDIKAKLFPESVFFRGQTAPAQMRNTGGIHFSDD